MASYSDNFNRETGIGAGWASDNIDVDGSFTKLTVDNNADRFARYESDLASVNHETSVNVVVNRTGEGGNYAVGGPAVRMTTAAITAPTGYYARLRVLGPSTTVDLFISKVVAGTRSDLAGPIDITSVYSDNLPLRLKVSGGSDPTLVAYYNNVEKASFHDTSSPLTTGVRGGVFMYRAAGPVYLDNWTAADLAGGDTISLAVMSDAFVGQTLGINAKTQLPLSVGDIPFVGQNLTINGTTVIVLAVGNWPFTGQVVNIVEGSAAAQAFFHWMRRLGRR